MSAILLNYKILQAGEAKVKREKILSEEKTYEPAVPDREDYKELGERNKKS